MFVGLQRAIGEITLDFNQAFYYRLFTTLVVFFVIWGIRSLTLKIVQSRQKSPTKIFRWRKITNSVAFLLSLLTLFHFWVESLQLLFTLLSLVAAALVITWKEPFLSLAGWIYIIWRKPFNVGDRIQIGDYKGDVIDISLFRFIMVEVGNWVQGDQSTGGILHYPNLKVFTDPISNYTQGFHYVWNEVIIHLSFESDWQRAKEVILEIANEDLLGIAESARKDLEQAHQHYLIIYKNLDPIIYLKAWDKSIDLTLRYLCSPRKRRSTESQLWEKILLAISAEKNIHLTSV